MNPQGDSSKPSILALDDDPVVLALLQEHLHEHFDVSLFHRGESALEWLRSGNSVDVMLVDLHMPEIDGLDFLRESRSMGDGPSTPLLMLSASGKRDDRVSGLRAGAVDFVGKPFDPEDLRTRLSLHIPSTQIVIARPDVFYDFATWRRTRSFT
jgi:DNA-binding response OmpR family regulator